MSRGSKGRAGRDANHEDNTASARLGRHRMKLSQSPLDGQAPEEPLKNDSKCGEVASATVQQYQA